MQQAAQPGQLLKSTCLAVFITLGWSVAALASTGIDIDCDESSELLPKTRLASTSVELTGRKDDEINELLEAKPLTTKSAVPAPLVLSPSMDETEAPLEEAIEATSETANTAETTSTPALPRLSDAILTKFRGKMYRTDI